MSYQVGDTKKEDFRKYLERNGIVDALTKVLVGLYEEPDKPENPLDYVKHFLTGPSEVDVEAMKAEISDLQKQVESLTNELMETKKNLSMLQSGNGGPTMNTTEFNEPLVLPAIDLSEPEGGNGMSNNSNTNTNSSSGGNSNTNGNASVNVPKVDIH